MNIVAASQLRPYMADEREVQVNCYSFASVGGPLGISKHTCRNERTAVT